MQALVKQAAAAALVALLCGGATAACVLSVKSTSSESKTDNRESGVEACYVCGECYWEWVMPCESGTYDIYIDAIYEKDGAPPYWVYINGKEIASGKYNYTGGSHSCDDKQQSAKHLVKRGVQVCRGDEVRLKGKCVREGCGSHGAYLRNRGLILERQGSAGGCGGSSEPLCGDGTCDSGEDCAGCEKDCGICAGRTRILSPADGADMIEGRAYALKGEGDGLKWSYDAASDGKGAVDLGSGASVTLTVPTGVKSPRTLAVTLAGVNGTDSRTYPIVSEPTDVRRSGAAAGRPAVRVETRENGRRLRVMVPGARGVELVDASGQTVARLEPEGDGKYAATSDRLSASFYFLRIAIDGRSVLVAFPPPSLHR